MIHMEEKKWFTYRCIHCRFIWRQLVPEGTPKPKICPKCGSPSWQPRTVEEKS
ncbi:MAG: hypothetical protein PHF74_02915 [Dehalococcoidales bacterium]|nr:hypothetical protein [Dehalococcoidales bacterium]